MVRETRLLTPILISQELANADQSNRERAEQVPKPAFHQKPSPAIVILSECEETRGDEIESKVMIGRVRNPYQAFAHGEQILMVASYQTTLCSNT